MHHRNWYTLRERYNQGVDEAGSGMTLAGGRVDLLLPRRTQKVPIVEGVNGWR